MSGLTIRQILMCTNYWVKVRIVDEFGEVFMETRMVMDALKSLTDKQLDMKFDYLSTSDYHYDDTNIMVIGMNSDTVWEG